MWSVAFYMLDKVPAPELVVATVAKSVQPYAEEHEIPLDELLLQYIRVKNNCTVDTDINQSDFYLYCTLHTSREMKSASQNKNPLTGITVNIARISAQELPTYTCSKIWTNT